MQLSFDKKLALGYKSPSQKIRVLTESWVDNQVFCPNCGQVKIEQYESNRPAADFFCSNCNEDYELKSKKYCIGNKIVDGAYQTMMESLHSGQNSNFFLLNYEPVKLEVLNFLVIPKHFFVPEIIEKRKPLSSTARRAGWVGCNIILNHIPNSGKIFLVKEGQIQSKQEILAEWKKTLFLREEREISVKGWLLDTMRCIEKLGKKEFSLDDIYVFEKSLSKLHPDNRHIKDKIRQQLQVLRDRNYLNFISRGYYRLV